MHRNMKPVQRLALWALAAWAASLCPCRPATAQNAAVAPQAAEQPTLPEGDAFVPQMNTNTAADRDLRVARDLAAAGAYVEASQCYAALVAAHTDVIVPADEHLHLPLWRALIDDILGWPAEGQRAYRETVAEEARAAWDAARRQADLRAIETVVHRWFLSDVGDDAAVALADRCREAAQPALALYYYKLVLDKHPACDLPRRALWLRAALAARAAGVPALAADLADALARAESSGAEDAPPPAAAEWIRRPTDPAENPVTPSSGGGFRSDTPAADPAAVIWQNTILRTLDDQTEQSFQAQSRHFQQGTVTAVPPVMPVVHDRVVYVAHLHVVRALDADTGDLLWQFDTRQEGSPGRDGPVLECQARQPLVAGGVVYAPLEDGKSNNTGVFMLNQGQGSIHTSLYALAADSGRMLWHWDPQRAGLEFGELSIDGMPVESHGAVIVALGTPGAFYGEAHTAALDGRTGKLLWSQPVVGYPAGYIGQQNPWSFSTRNVSASVAVRDGIVLVNALGVTAAQSLLSGRVLWVRTMADMRQIPFERTQRASAGGGRLVRGMPLARLPRVLADRDLVVSGCILSPHLEAYHWIDGSLAWRRPSEDAPYLLALDRGRGVAWGAKVLVFDLATGQAAWPPLALDAPPAGEPVLARDTLLVPSATAIIAVDLTAGRIAGNTTLPAGFSGGNLAIGPAGLLVATDRDLVNYLDWDTALRQFTDAAAARPDDARPWMTLGAAALRFGKTIEGLDYLDKALDRVPLDEQAAELYQLYEDFYLHCLGGGDTTLAPRVADRLRDAALDPDSACRQAMLRAEAAEAQGDARAAIGALQDIFDGHDLRHVQMTFVAGTGVSGILAERQIERLLARHGRATYAPWDNRAAAALDAARKARDYDALIEVACRWPNSLAAPSALDEALAIVMARDDLNEASRLLARLVHLTPDGKKRRRYLALAAQVSQRLGLTAQAELHALALAAAATPDAAVSSLDGGTTTATAVAASVARGHLVGRTEPLPPAADGPYRLAWSLEPDDEFAQLAPVLCADLPASSRVLCAVHVGDQEALVLANRRLATAVRRSDGAPLWTFRRELSEQDARSSRFVLGRHALYSLERGAIARISLDDGTLQWRVALQPAWRYHAASRPATLTGALRYGDAEFTGGADEFAANVTELGDTGDVVAVATGSSFYLLDTRDGYALRTVGYPQGLNGGMARCGRRAWGIPVRPTAMRQRVLVWDIITGDLESDTAFDEMLNPYSAPWGASRWPVFTDSGTTVTVFDAETGRFGPPLALGDSQIQWFYQRSAFVDGDVLTFIHPADGLKAVDLSNGRTLWTFQNDVRQPIQFTPVDGGRLLVRWDKGLALVRRSDGRQLWRLSDPTWQRIGVPQVFANRFLLSVNKKVDDKVTGYQALHDLETGQRTFLLDRPDGTPVGAVHADAAGLLVRGGPNDPIELWVSDPAGPWTDRSDDGAPTANKQQ